METPRAEIMTPQPFFQNIFVLWRRRVINFAETIKIATMFIKTTFKDSKKVKKTETIYQNAVYSISWYKKIADFL